MGVEKIIVQVMLPVTASQVAIFDTDVEKITKYYERIIAMVYYPRIVKEVTKGYGRNIAFRVKRIADAIVNVISLLRALSPVLIYALMKKKNGTAAKVLKAVFNLDKDMNRNWLVEQRDFKRGEDSRLPITEVNVSTSLKIQFISYLVPGAIKESAENILRKGFVKNLDKFISFEKRILVSEDVDIIPVAYNIPGVIITPAELESLGDLVNKVNLLLVDSVNDRVTLTVIIGNKKIVYSTQLSSLMRKPETVSLSPDELFQLLKGTKRISISE